MKRFLSLLAAAIIFVSFNANAESTVYLFLKKVANADVQVFVNGKNVCDMNAPIVKTMDNDMFKIPMKFAQDCTRKLIFDNEGKVVIGSTYDYRNPMKDTLHKGKAETQLDLEDGETYYIEITNKGLNDMQLKVMDAKKGAKRAAQSKRHNFPDVKIGKE